MIRDGIFLLRCFALISVAVAVKCLLASISGGVPMPTETHGTAIHTIPAEAWSLVSLAQAIAFFWLVGSRRYLSLAAVAAMGAIINLALAVFSARAEFGFIQSAVTGGIGVMHCVICIAAMVDALGCRIVRLAKMILERIDR